jgi:hypothetical protein
LLCYVQCGQYYFYNEKVGVFGFVLVGLGFELSACASKAGTVLLEPCLQSRMIGGRMPLGELPSLWVGPPASWNCQG